MKKQIITLAVAVLSVFTAETTVAQTTGMDFNRKDCDGINQHLFADLNAGNVVILEFFMNNCSSCITAASKINPMKSNILSQYPGKVKSYSIGYTNSYSKALVKTWANTNSVGSIPMDSGSAQVAYYGGFGMPTIVILGGTNHALLGSPYIGFSTSDTTMMATDIRNYLNGATAIKENNSLISELSVYPNPANTEAKVSFNLKNNSHLIMELIDITGKVVVKLVDENVQSGVVTKTINTSNIATGNYTLRMSTNNGLFSTQKLSIVR